MDLHESFAPLDPGELRTLGVKRDGPGLVRLGLLLPLTLISGVALVQATGAWELALLLLVHGFVLFLWFPVLHETCHRTAFASPALNLTAAWLAALPQLTSPAQMRVFHFAHHRHTHDPALDPELGGVEALAAWPRGAMALAWLTGLLLVAGRVSWLVFGAVGLWPGALWERVMPFVPAPARPALSRDNRLLLLGVLGLGVAAWVHPPLVRLLAALLLGHAVLATYVVVEHRGLPTTGPVLARTRSFGGGPVVDFLMWNMPFHAEHHAWPGVPFHALPALRAQVADRLPHRFGSYWAALWAGWRARDLRQ